MKKEKIVFSLILMLVLIFTLALSTFATSDPATITTITAGGNTSTGTGESTPITPSTNGSVPISATNTGAPATNGTTTISAGNVSTAVTNNSTGTPATSSYGNSTNTRTNNGLPYTGSSYGIVFVIIALVISAVYAYKKVSDYNM